MRAALSRPFHTASPRARRRVRVVQAAASIGVLLFGLTSLAPSAGAVDVKPSSNQVWGTSATVDLTPSLAPTNSSTVSGTITGMADYLGAPVADATSIAVSFCGNFRKDGTTPLTLAEQTSGTAGNAGQAYCDGTQDLVSHTLPFLSTSGSSLSFSKALRSGQAAGDDIGNSPDGSFCLPGGLVPCVIAIATTSNSNPSGQNWAIKIPVFGGPGTGTTTTTADPGTTTTTADPGTTTTTADPGTTTTTTAPTTTTTAPGTTTTTPSGPTLVVEPSSNLIDGQILKVKVTGLGAFEGQPVAVTECGNATTAGAPLPSGPGVGDCFGGDGLPKHLLLLAVSGGTVETDYPMALAGIGTNKLQCTASVPSPCYIRVADVITSGQTLDLKAPVTAKAGAVGVPSQAGGGSTTSTATAEVKGATATAASGTLPYTGPAGASPWLVGAIGFALLDLGWLASSAVRPRRRQR